MKRALPKNPKNTSLPSSYQTPTTGRRRPTPLGSNLPPPGRSRRNRLKSERLAILPMTRSCRSRSPLPRHRQRNLERPQPIFSPKRGHRVICALHGHITLCAPRGHRGIRSRRGRSRSQCSLRASCAQCDRRIVEVPWGGQANQQLRCRSQWKYPRTFRERLSPYSYPSLIL